MPGVDLNAVYADPEFQGLSDDDKKAVLSELGYGGLAGGAGASMGPGQAPSAWDQAREVIGNAIFGTPERAEAKAAGLGVETTPSELVQGAAMAAGPMLAPEALGSVPGAVSGMTKAVLPYLPKAYGAVSGMKQGYRVGGVPGALAGAVTGYMKPAGTGGVSGAIEGFESGGLPGAVGGAVLGTVMGGGGEKVANVAKALRSPAAARAEAAAAQAAAKSTSAAPAPTPAAATPTAAPANAAMDAAQELEGWIVKMRTQGLSGAQITSALLQRFGSANIRPAQAQKMVNMVLDTHGIQSGKAYSGMVR